MSREISKVAPEFTLSQVAHNPILRSFSYQHLRSPLREVSEPFAKLAAHILSLPPNAERTTALRKLREAKDCAVTSVVWQLQIEEEKAETQVGDD